MEPGHQVPCPQCQALIGPETANAPPPAQAGPPLPPAKALMPAPTTRGASRESWESKHQDKKPLALRNPGERVAAEVRAETIDTPLESVDAAAVAPEDPLERHRKKVVHRRPVTPAPPAWDQGDSPGGAGRRRRRRRNEIRRARAVWLAVIAGGACAAVITWQLIARRDSARFGAAGGATAGRLPNPMEVATRPGSFRATSDDDYQQVVATVAKFVAARTLDEALPLVRDPGRIGPLLESAFVRHPPDPQKIVSISKRAELTNYEGLLVGFVELGDYSQRIFAVERTPQGFFFDWESYVGWCEVPWEKLADVRPTQSVLLRAQIAADTYYNRAFADDAAYACFRLSSLDKQHSVYGYVERGSPLFTELTTRTALSPLTLGMVKVRYPERSVAGDQVEITEWVASGWVWREKK